MKKFQRKAQSQPKHGPPSVSSASKAPATPPSHRPEFRGSGYTKKSTKHQPAPVVQAPAAKVAEQYIPDNLHQLILDVFQETFPSSNEFEALKPALREIKDDIARRDFQRAFGTEERMERYTIRWSPSLALAYSNILAGICEDWKDNEWVKRFNDDSNPNPLNVLSFSRGAAELVASIAMLKYVHPSATGQPGQSVPENAEEISENLGSLVISEPQSISDKVLLNACLVDTANWTNVISKLHQTYITPRPLSKYASAKARASNTSPISRQALSWKFSQLDILECGIEELRSMIGPNPTLLTFFFTLSELYLTSISKVSALLLKITTAAPKGSLLLVVDHPEVSVVTRVPNPDNNEMEEKTHTMHSLMYRMLLLGGSQKPQKNKEVKGPAWEKLVDDSHCLFKLPTDLRFPVSLENTKYQMHLLQRV